MTISLFSGLIFVSLSLGTSKIPVKWAVKYCLVILLRGPAPFSLQEGKGMKEQRLLKKNVHERAEILKKKVLIFVGLVPHI